MMRKRTVYVTLRILASTTGRVGILSTLVKNMGEGAGLWEQKDFSLGQVQWKLRISNIN